LSSNPSADPPTAGAQRIRAAGILALTVVAAVFLFARPAIPQSLAYHDFADQRALLGVPHFWNVVSNVPFLIVGTAGLWVTLPTQTAFRTPGERWAYLCFFAGVAGTAFGSTYYHLAPDNDRLVWDRLPMAIAFMGLFDAIIAERIGVRIGRALLVPLLALGIGSVWYWHATDDLRLYYLVQFYPALAMPLMLLAFPPRYTGTVYFFLALGCYVAAKFCEHPFDATIYEASGQTLSGHTLKHLLAAAAVACIAVMLARRRPLCADGAIT
jgi:hypothetical protein